MHDLSHALLNAGINRVAIITMLAIVMIHDTPVLIRRFKLYEFFFDFYS